MRMRRSWMLASVLSLATGVVASAQENLPPPTKGGTTRNPAATAPGKNAAPSGSTKSGTGSASGSTTKSPAAGSGAPKGAGGAAGSTSGSSAGGAKPAAGRAGTPPRITGGTGAAAAGVTAEQRDLASYAIGLDIAARFAADGMQVNPEQILQGIKDGFAGGKPRYTEDKLRAAAEAFERDVQVKAQKRFAEMSEKNKEDGATFLTENKKKKGIKTLASGLQYEVLKAGTGKSPKSTDKIRAHYHGTLVDGTVFDTTQNDQPIDIEVQGAIPGWTEALQLMKAGDKWRLFVPPELAYGAEGFGPVPPNAVLVFELELIEVLSPVAQSSAKPASLLPPPTTKK